MKFFDSDPKCPGRSSTRSKHRTQDPQIHHEGKQETGHSIRDRWDKTLVKPSKGDRQGDPISSPILLFNLVMSGVLKILPDDWNPEGTEKLNHLAFADEVVLLSKKQTGLQDSINRLETGLERCGLSLSQRQEVCNTRCTHSAKGPTGSDKPEHSVQQQGRRTHRNDSRLFLPDLALEISGFWIHRYKMVTDIELNRYQTKYRPNEHQKIAVQKPLVAKIVTYLNTLLHVKVA